MRCETKQPSNKILCIVALSIFAFQSTATEEPESSVAKPNPPSSIIDYQVRNGLEKLFQKELKRYAFNDTDHDISGNYQEVSSFIR